MVATGELQLIVTLSPFCHTCIYNLHLLMSVFRYSHAFKRLSDYQLKQLLLLAKYETTGVRRDDDRGLHLVGHITGDASGTKFI